MNKIKVKKTGDGPFKNNKLGLVLGGTVATIFLLILLKAWLNRAEDDGISDKVTTAKSPRPRQRPPERKDHKAIPTKHLSKEEAVRQIQQMNLRARGVDTQKLTYQMQQLKLLKDFQKLSRLKVELPGHLHYTTVDPEEGIAGVVGSSVNGDETFAMLATHGNVSVDKVLAFLNDQDPSLPMMSGHRPMTEKIFTDPAPASTGLGTLTIIPTTDTNGKRFMAVIAPRLDGKGTYLFMREGAPNTFEENDGYYDLMLKGMKTE